MANGVDFIATYQQREKARTLQKRADNLTRARLYGAVPMSAVMATSEPSWATTGLDAFLWITDKLDGHYGKKARKQWAGLARTKISKLDPFADKEMQYSNDVAVAVRAAREGDSETAIVMSANIAVSAWRDKRMGSHRARATEHGVTPDAIGINKLKTGAVALSDVVLLSPLANNEAVRRAALVARTAATIVGVVGEKQFGAHIDANIAELNAAAQLPSDAEAV